MRKGAAISRFQKDDKSSILTTNEFLMNGVTSELFQICQRKVGKSL